MNDYCLEMLFARIVVFINTLMMKHYNNDVFKLDINQCFGMQITYIVTLLEHGYQLTDENSDNTVSIQFLRHINGESVDWTYGAALFMVIMRVYVLYRDVIQFQKVLNQSTSLLLLVLYYSLLSFVDVICSFSFCSLSHRDADIQVIPP